MSLTNPNKVVTEQRLNEYHNTILPYLGGMPEMVANKFSKGDLYSTEERMIGQWIDGKPLYQKTVDCGALPNNTIKEVSHGIANIDQYVNIFGIFWSTSGTGETGSLPFSSTNDNDCVGVWTKNKLTIVLQVGMNRTAMSACVTLQYTKTTDSPISIGSDTDYSTEEKIVGTWIDGKPLYQKVVQVGALTNTSSSIYKMVSIGASIDKFIKIEAYGNFGSGIMSLGFFNSNQSTNGIEILPLGCNNLDSNYANKVGFEYKGQMAWIIDTFIITQYTKTTD